MFNADFRIRNISRIFFYCRMTDQELGKVMETHLEIGRYSNPLLSKEKFRVDQ